MMQTYLFDDKGELWDGKSRRLADALYASLSSDDLLKYVIRNLGFIAVTENSGSLRLQLRPAIVSQTALGGLLYWMHDRAIERVLISALDEEWSHELVASRDEAVRRLLARVRFSPADRDGDFLSRPRPLHQLQRSSPLRAALDAWSATQGRYDPEVIRPSLQKALDDRFVLIDAPSGSRNLLINDVGSGLTRLAEYWLSRARGLRVEDQPDYAYGKWVAQLYQQALSCGEPLLEDVDAVVMWPGQPRQSYCYRRLILPFKRRDGSSVLLGTTLRDPGIDLRIKRNQELLQVLQ
jgi:hypothetical protein